MATFSVNQARQLYVANSLGTGTVDNNSAAGTIKTVKTSDGKYIYFQYRGADNIMRSDLMKIGDILCARATDAEKLATPLKQATVALNAAALKDDKPIAGQDYILRIMIRQYIGMSDEDTYMKYGIVHAYENMTKEEFYQTMLDSLNKNFAKEPGFFKFAFDGAQATTKLTTNSGVTVTAVDAGTAGNNIKFAVKSVSASAPKVEIAESAGVTTISASLATAHKTIKDLKSLIAGDAKASNLVTITGTDGTDVSAETTAVALKGGTTTGLLIKELEQPWRLGTMEQVPVYFEVTTDYVQTASDEVLWGTVTKGVQSESIKDGKKIADLEYFCMGERGDIYRNISWPNSIPTVYLVDPTKEYGTIDIHFAYVGGNENPQKSEKTITIAVPKDPDNTLINSIISNINSVAGLSIDTL